MWEADDRAGCNGTGELVRDRRVFMGSGRSDGRDVREGDAMGASFKIGPFAGAIAKFGRGKERALAHGRDRLRNQLFARADCHEMED